jgi:hypothetical protein
MRIPLTLALALALVTVPVLARTKPGAKKPVPSPSPAKAEEESEDASPEAPPAPPVPSAAEDEGAADAAAIAKMLAAGDAAAPTGPPPLIAKKLVPVLAAINARLKFDPPLKMIELQYFGATDVDGDGAAELIVSWARGRDQGGVALARRELADYRVVAVADVKEPVLRVQAMSLAGDKSHHLLIRSGTNDPARGTIRTSAIWGVVGKSLGKIWERQDVDAIENNPDLSKDREATMSEIQVNDGGGGKPGSIVVNVSEYRAPKGKGAESAETRGARTLLYTFDRAKHLLVLQSKEEQPVDKPAPDAAASRDDK